MQNSPSSSLGFFISKYFPSDFPLLSSPPRETYLMCTSVTHHKLTQASLKAY